MNTVFIPTAGIGSRLGELTKHQNKSLVNYKQKPVISHILDKFDHKTTSFVIALGHKGNFVKQYLKIAHSNLKFKFIKISNYQGKGSGLGLTLIKSKKFLKKPFLFYPCDSLIKYKFKFPSKKNVIYFREMKNDSQYRYLSLKKKKLLSINEKDHKSQKIIRAYTGIAFINDHKEFWKFADTNNEDFINIGETFLINKMLKNKDFFCQKINWLDSGNMKSFEKLNSNKQNLNILEKKNEDIYFIKNKVIKFHLDKKFINQRVERSKILTKYVPKVKKFSDNFYLYEKIDGNVLSKVVDPEIFEKFLLFLKNFWEKKLIKPSQKKFEQDCLYFYKNKTLKRLKLFSTLYPNYYDQNINYINNNRIQNLDYVIKKINWKNLSQGIPVNFHGDLHFENIIVDKNGKFKLLDWRQNFNSNLHVGDIYYDLAKIKHGILINHKDVVNNRYSYNFLDDDKVKLNLKISKNYKNLLNQINDWILNNNYDIKKVNVITALIFLNISPLHHYPYSTFLFFLGKLMLNYPFYFDEKLLKSNKNIK